MGKELYFCVGCSEVHYDKDYCKEDGDLLIRSKSRFLRSVKEHFGFSTLLAPNGWDDVDFNKVDCIELTCKKCKHINVLIPGEGYDCEGCGDDLIQQICKYQKEHLNEQEKKDE